MSFPHSDPPPRWFWVAGAVGMSVGASSIALGFLLGFVGNWANACPGELGCILAFVVGVLGAPFCAAVGALAGGLTAARAARKSESTGGAIWKRSFAFGFLSLLPSTFLGYAVIPSIL
jgi:uncharacterized membrane protein YeaQ/YmgE (transglycosylase-associated protein family)